MAEASRTSGSDDLSHLLSTEGDKWKWKGTVEELETFITTTHSLTIEKKITKDDEKSHQFKVCSPSASIKFWTTAQTLFIQGKESEELKNRLDEKSKGNPDIDESLSGSKSEEATSSSEVIKLAMQKIPTESEDRRPEQDDINIKDDKKKISEAKSLALQFMSKNPGCIRAIPYESKDAKSLTMCLYMDTNREKISEEIKIAANEMFKNYNIEFVDLPHRRPSKIFTPLPTSKKKKGKDLADLTRKIEKNLHLFEDRMNVTAVQASYKVTDSMEEGTPCVRVYVLGKGRIPAGETDINAIKKKIEYDHPLKKTIFDVAEGYHKLATGSSLKGHALPLESGVGIGVKGVHATGTLGGFLEDEDRNVYILSNKHVLHPTDDAGDAIFQPSQDDNEEMQREAERNMQRLTSELQKTQEENEVINQEYRNLLVRRIDQKIQKNINLLSEIKKNPPRQIGTYVCGLENNVSINGEDFYVDAAIATLKEKELGLMRYHKNDIEDPTDRCPLYGFGTNKYWETVDYNPPNGEIINFTTFQNLLDSGISELRFMKIGRTTGFTGEGFVEQPLLFLRRSQPGDFQVSFSWACNCLPIQKRAGSFSERGDSGSLVFDQHGRAWGLVFARFGDSTLVLPLFAIVEALKRENGPRSELRLWRTPNHE